MSPEPSVRWPAVATAVLLAVAINCVVPYTQHAILTTSLLEGMMPLGIFLPFIVLVFALNPLARLLFGRALFSGRENVFIFAAGFLSASIGEVTGRMIAVISSPNYFATTENQWGEFVQPNLPGWVLVGNQAGALRRFYEGIQPGEAIPWSVWVAPLLWWLSFIGAIAVASVAIGVILRRQWVERERLPFPLAEVPLLLARARDGGAPEPPFYRRPLFWAGFAVPFFIVMWHVATFFYPLLPDLRIDITWSSIRFGRDFPPMYTRVNFFIVGFAYFTDLRILLSIWLFHLLAALQVGLSTRVGLATELSGGGIYHQELGGLVFFVLASLWVARRHLRHVFRSAFFGSVEANDRDELVSYRWAVWALLLSALYCVGWLMRAGLRLDLALLFLFISLVFYLGLARILALSGLVFLAGASNTQGLMLDVLPRSAYTPSSLAAGNVLFTMYQNNKGFCLPAASHTAKLGAELGGRAARKLGRTALAGFALALLASVVVTVWLGHRQGAYNFASYTFRTANQYPFNNTVTQIKEMASGVPYQKWAFVFFVFGALVTAALTVLTYRFPWWPLHPAGFTVAFAWSVRTAVMSVFVAWAVKGVLLRIGGIDLYRRARPAFLGLIVGYATGILIAMLVDVTCFPVEAVAAFGGLPHERTPGAGQARPKTDQEAAGKDTARDIRCNFAPRRRGCCRHLRMARVRVGLCVRRVRPSEGNVLPVWHQVPLHKEGASHRLLRPVPGDTRTHLVVRSPRRRFRES